MSEEQGLLAAQERVDNARVSLADAMTHRRETMRAAQAAGMTVYRIAKIVGMSQQATAKELRKGHAAPPKRSPS